MKPYRVVDESNTVVAEEAQQSHAIIRAQTAALHADEPTSLIVELGKTILSRIERDKKGVVWTYTLNADARRAPR